jgi:hypothetical protein
MSEQEDNTLSNTFMWRLRTCLHNEIHLTVKQLEKMAEQPQGYSRKFDQEMIEVASSLAQLHWTEYVLLSRYADELPIIPRGARNASEIRDRLANGEKAVDLAKEYGVSESAISRYKHANRRKVPL